MLQNANLLAKIGADTAENEQHFAEILLKIGIPANCQSSTSPSRMAMQLAAICALGRQSLHRAVPIRVRFEFESCIQNPSTEFDQTS